MSTPTSRMGFEDLHRVAYVHLFTVYKKWKSARLEMKTGTAEAAALDEILPMLEDELVRGWS